MKTKLLFTGTGVVLLGIALGFKRLAGIGVDPFSCMNMGVSSFLHLGFGTWQLMVNCLLFLLMVLWFRQLIGPGTLLNMVFIGYIGDFVMWLAGAWAPGLPVRLLLFAAGLLLMAMGAGFYMVPQWGVAPYDALAIILSRKAHTSFRLVRVMLDVICVGIGMVSAYAAGVGAFANVGLGTLVGALANGPLIQVFHKGIAQKLYDRAVRKT